MTDPKIRILFSEAELRAMGRCDVCGWHPKTQGHLPACPRNPETKGQPDETVPQPTPKASKPAPRAR